MTPDQLTDRIMICELKARYCRLLDTKQWEAWTQIFTDDLVLDTSEAGGPPTIRGRDEAIAMVRATLGQGSTAHQVHTPEIKIEGDSAEAIWAMQDRVLFPDGSALTGYGHYIETYSKRGGAWQISKSKLTRLHVDFTSAT